MNRINKIVNALNENKIRYNSGLAKIYQDGIASEVCKSFCDEIISDLERIIEYSVNNGFNKTRDTIDKLSDILVAQTNKNAEQRLSRNKDIKADILRDCRIEIEEDYPIITELDKLLYFSLEGVKLYRQNNDFNEEEKLFLDKFVALLEEIRVNLEFVWNKNSKVASEYQTEIFDAIVDCGENVGNGFFKSSILSTMEIVLEQVKNWQNDNVYKKDKTLEFRTIKKTKSNSLITAASIKDALEEFNSVKNTYLRYVAETKRVYNTEEIRSNILNYEKEKIDINKSYDACINDALNGVITKGEATSKMKNYDLQLASIDKKINELTKLRKSREKMYDSRTSIATQLSSVFDNVDLFKASPNKFYALTREADFRLIAKLLSGNITEEEVSNAIIKIQGIVKQYRYIITEEIKLSETIINAVDEIENEYTEQIIIDTEDNDQKLDEEEEFFNMLKKRGGYVDQNGKVKKDTLPGEDDKNEAIKINKSTII